jgi:4-diphosphocytidyl-2-C-methyl-D-erythritol kinase
MRYRSYAKINLYLDVLDRRPDGFTNIETVFQTVSLYDELEFEPAQPGIALTCTNPDLPTDERNLVYRAAELLRGFAGDAAGVRITLRKRIPVAAGLAGGSGNAAATLLALSQLWDLHLGAEELRMLALGLGSDVPYCLVGGTAAATRRGDLVAPMDPLPEVWFVLVHPPVQLSTASVYASPLLEHSPPQLAGAKSPALLAAMDALPRGDWSHVRNAMETAVFPEHPELAALKARLLDAGCLAAAMSGSGPTVFGVAGSREEANRVAQAMAPEAVTVAYTAPAGVDTVN